MDKKDIELKIKEIKERPVYQAKDGMPNPLILIVGFIPLLLIKYVKIMFYTIKLKRI